MDKDDRIEVCYPDVLETVDSMNHRQLDQKVEAFGVDAEVNN